jgi:hypothetical protein
MMSETTTAPGTQYSVLSTQYSDTRARQAEAVGRARRRQFLLETALSLLLPVVLWATGAAQRVVDALGLGPADALISASGPAAWLALAAGVVLLILAFRLVLLPVGYCVGYRVSRRYGLNTQSTPAWLVDWV